jgi:drug/metabolite transporter (DMT)-like permease
LNTVVITPVAPASRTPQGIVAILLGMTLFVFQDAMMKSLLVDFPVWPLLLVRAVVCSLVMVPLILYLGPPHRILSPLWRLHVTRALLFAFGFSLYYAAFPFMTLAAVTTIFFAAPLLTAVFASVFLKEHIGIHRISALALGFVGVIIAMKPGADSFQWVSLLPLICACSYATSQMLARRIGDRDTAMVAGAYTIILAGVIVLPLGWSLNVLFDIGAHAAAYCPGSPCWAPSAWSPGRCCPGPTRSPTSGQSRRSSTLTCRWRRCWAMLSSTKCRPGIPWSAWR